MKGPYYSMGKMKTLAIDLQNELAEFQDRLDRFDFNYDLTDSHNIYRAAVIELDTLKTIADKGPEFAELFNNAKDAKTRKW